MHSLELESRGVKMINEGLSITEKLNIVDIYKDVKINWTNFYAEFGDCQNDSPIEFEVTPSEYLQFAKDNFRDNSKQSCINAMGNAKRAIDCQIDMLINTLGYEYKQFDARNSYPEVKAFIKKNYDGDHYSGITERLKLLNILGLAPTLIISNIRKMRNEMEHEYKIPQYEEVKKAIEIAELFINSSNRKLSYAPTYLRLGNNKKTAKERERYGYIGSYLSYPYIDIVFCTYHSVDTIKISSIKDESSERNFNREDIVILKPEDEHYIEIVHCLLNESCSMIANIFNNTIEEKYVNYTLI